jgi:hypothetical protein
MACRMAVHVSDRIWRDTALFLSALLCAQLLVTMMLMALKIDPAAAEKGIVSEKV